MKKILLFLLLAAGALQAQVLKPFSQLSVIGTCDPVNDRIVYLHWNGSSYGNCTINPSTLLGLTPPAWSLTGNSGTDPSINFIGTFDPEPLMFKVGNKFSGMIGMAPAPGRYQTFFGWLCGGHSASNSNSGFGYEALLSNVSGGGNSAFGMSSQYNQNGSLWNSSIGQGALYTNVIGSFNTAAGAFALYLNTASNNTAVGYNAIDNTTTGGDNVAIGNSAGASNITGSTLTFLGDNTDVTSDGLVDATAVGYGAQITTDYQVVLGDASVTILQLPNTNGAGIAPMNTLVPVGWYIITITGSVGNYFLPLYQ